jgi:curved DNA-binding protein CbpA
VLGLVPGASPGEIRSAYRRLAKMHHPDTAGERSLGRFLAIKAAYEELVDAEGRLRARGWPRGAAAATTRPSSAGAKGASRDAWRARRGSGAASNATNEAKADDAKADEAKAGPTADGAKASGARTKPGASGPAGPDAEDAKGGAGAKRRAKADGTKSGGGAARGSGTRGKSAERRTARPGSTTYDEATQPLDPSWEGATWYGASSGSYWTLNPREYADPRKHGPEYQERAKRAVRVEAQLRARKAAAAAAASAASSASDAPATETPSASSATVEPDASERSS